MLENNTDAQRVRHLNKVDAKGKMIEMVRGESKTNIPFVNLLLEVVGKKYTEKIPFVSYGSLVDSILSTAKVGDTVQIYGRVRSKEKNGRVSVSLICEQFDVIK